MLPLHELHAGRHHRLHLNRALITPTVFIYCECVRLPFLLGECFRRVKNGLLIISSSEQMSRRNDPYSSPTNPLFSSRYVCWEKRVKLRIRRSSPLSFFLTGWRKAASSGGWKRKWVESHLRSCKYFEEMDSLLERPQCKGSVSLALRPGP